MVQIKGNKFIFDIMANRKPVVDQNTCIGCGTCVALCPNTFAMGDNGKSHVTNPDGHSEQEIQGAIDACPVAAISWEEDVKMPAPTL